MRNRNSAALLAELYQVLGALDAPGNVLDQVSAAMQGKRLPHETLLPFLPEREASRQLDHGTAEQTSAFRTERESEAQAGQPTSEKDLVITQADVDAARALIHECVGTDLISGDRPAKNADRAWVCRKLIEAATCLVGDVPSAREPDRDKAPRGALSPVGTVRVEMNLRGEISEVQCKWSHEFEGHLDANPGVVFNVYAAPQGLLPASDKVLLTDDVVDRILRTHIPGGSQARDWFLQHESELGEANVRDVVRAMIAHAAYMQGAARQKNAQTWVGSIPAEESDADFARQIEEFERKQDAQPVGSKETNATVVHVHSSTRIPMNFKVQQGAAQHDGPDDPRSGLGEEIT